MLTLLAATVDQRPWPDGLDAAALFCFVAISIGLPAIGYAAMAADFRAWLRSLRRALVVVSARIPYMPGWVRVETPRCIAALGLECPCTEEDVLRQYRQRVKTLHPDLGGDKRKFLRLQRHFEEALQFLRDNRSTYRPAAEA